MTYKPDKLRDMIPEYLNNALSEQERQEFDLSIKKYPDIEEELREFSEIKSAYKLVHDEVPRPSDAVFQRVMSTIKADQKPSAVFRKPGFFDQVRDFFGPAFSSPRVSWAVVGVQMAVILLLVISVPRPNVPITLSSGQNYPLSGKTINVVFDSETREMEIRTILNKVEGIIINGPSSNGLYTIKIDEDRDVIQALEELNNSKAVRFAEKGYRNGGE